MKAGRAWSVKMNFVLCGLLAVAWMSDHLVVTAVASDSVRPRPNIVMILVDDLGWQDVTCYDIDEKSPMETPNIDRLASEGVMFWQAYSPAPTCSPTRCAIMSGVHPARAQKTHVVGGHPPVPHHRTAHAMMSPWYSGRMPADEYTLAKALQAEGYTTGHSGKWHMAIDHHAFPQPEDQGFDWSRSNRGATTAMRPDRFSDFATSGSGDPYRLDEDGFPHDQTTADALEFLQEHHADPFFLYYATWLVHTPIHTRSRILLEKYCRKLEVSVDPQSPEGWAVEGQKNPWYCAMVEMLDHYVGDVVTYLDETDDPRWPGHKLRENTYVIFTSDNGGMERAGSEIITDNAPLDRGKISLMEGGTRVPLMITGPGIKEDIQSDVMVNGLDFYPTVLAWAGIGIRDDKQLDGCNLSPLLAVDATQADLVRDPDGHVRNSMVWHFPNSVAWESTIRVGDYKLVRNYNYRHDPASDELELYRLYDSSHGKLVRVDIEESKNLAGDDAARASLMNQQLTSVLEQMRASYPYFNPAFRGAGDAARHTPKVQAVSVQDGLLRVTIRDRGNAVVSANLITTKNGGDRYEEWNRHEMQVLNGSTVTGQIPPGTTHYVINLIDSENFLVSYPELPAAGDLAKGDQFSMFALEVHSVEQ